MARNKNWYRLYDRMIDSPQILELNDSEFRLIVSIWCIASSEGKNGRVEYSDSILRRRLMPDNSTEEVQEMLEHLKKIDLLQGESGNYEVPRWEIHQYEYNSKIPRNRKNGDNNDEVNGKVMGSDCEEGGKTDTDTDAESDTDNINNTSDLINCEKNKNDSLDIKKPIKHQYTDDFERFWSIYPKRKEKLKAFKAWRARIKEKVSPEDIISAAENYKEYCRNKHVEEEYIKNPSTFIGPNKPYEDYIEPPDNKYSSTVYKEFNLDDIMEG